jgi:hypothetical protein
MMLFGVAEGDSEADAELLARNEIYKEVYTSQNKGGGEDA